MLKARKVIYIIKAVVNISIRRDSPNRYRKTAG